MNTARPITPPGELLRVLRLAQRRSRDAVAREAGVDSNRLGRVERGEIMPTTEELARVWGVLAPPVVAPRGEMVS